MVELFTIGVYGFAPAAFFEKLKAARIDTFCDIRRRRGVRGSEYAFANSLRLKAELEKVGIRYLHFIDLAPSLELRKRQASADKETHVARRKRSELSPEFIAGYREECLAGFESKGFMEQLGPDARRAVLFCVERLPEACHRSVVAERLSHDLNIPVTHLVP